MIDLWGDPLQTNFRDDRYATASRAQNASPSPSMPGMVRRPTGDSSSQDMPISPSFQPGQVYNNYFLQSGVASPSRIRGGEHRAGPSVNSLERSSSLVPDNRSMAGIGARRLAEASKKRADERVAWEAAQYRKRLREDEEQKQRQQQEEQQRWQAEQAAQQQARVRQQREQEDQRRRTEEQQRRAEERERARLAEEEQRQAEGQRRFEEQIRLQRAQRQQQTFPTVESSTSQQSYASGPSHESQQRSPPPPPTEDDAILFEATVDEAATAGPSYESRQKKLPPVDPSEQQRTRPRRNTRFHDTPDLRGSTLHFATPDRQSIRASTVASGNNRATIYEDDYEEGDDEVFANLSRYTRYEPTPEAEPEAKGAWSGARKSLFRSTTLHPMPKARCADCGQHLDFEELEDHSCEQTDIPGTPCIPMTPMTMASDDGRSPFLSGYEQFLGAPSPAGSVRASNVSAASQHGRAATIDERSSSADAAWQALTKGGKSPMTRSATTPSELNLAAADNESQEAARRRVMIEEQRAAKKRAAGAEDATTKSSSFAPHSVPFVSGGDHESWGASDSSPSTQRSSVFESCPSPSPVSLAITPSSSFSASEMMDRSPNGAAEEGRKDLLTPAMARNAQSDKTAQMIAEARRQRQAEQLEALRSASAASSTSSGFYRRRNPAKELDLGGIEDLMKELECSTDEQTKSRRPKVSPLNLSIPSRNHNFNHSGNNSRSTPRSCCICHCVLSRSSKTQRFVERDGQYFCAEDYRQRYLPKCQNCHEFVEKNAVKSSDGALRGVWHAGCFRCSEDGCGRRFDDEADGIFYVFEEKPYCFEHYSANNGTLCCGCGNGIEGECRTILQDEEEDDPYDTNDGKKSSREERFHPNCLHCDFKDCRDPLEEFYVVQEKRMCEIHANEMMALQHQGSITRKRSKSQRSRAGSGEERMAKMEKRKTRLHMI